jgi:hypothetical protein
VRAASTPPLSLRPKFLLEEEALVVVDHGTELMWEKGVAAFVKYFSNPTPEARLEELNTKKFAGFDNWRLPTLEEAMSLVTTHEEALATKRAGKEAIHLHPIFERTGTHCIWTSDSGIWTIILGEGVEEEHNVLWVVDFLEGRCALSPSFRRDGIRCEGSAVDEWRIVMPLGRGRRGWETPPQTNFLCP